MAVVVGVDGSKHAQQALEWAVGEARLRGDSVVAMLAYGLPPAHYPYGTPGTSDAKLAEQVDSGARSRLAEAVDAVREQAEGVEIVPEVIEHPQPAKALTERAGPDDILVVGSRGHGGFAGLLLGSVSQQCAQHARCPVVVVRASE